MSIWAKNKFFIIWLIFAIFSIAVLRLPNYQHELINWDEHTFMLSGADLLDGNLPYIKTLDNKPPFLYVNVALAFILFGRSVIGFRIFGDLCILTVSIFIFLIGRRLFNNRSAAYGALSFIALMSAPFAAHTSSEIIALAYLMAALWILFNLKLNLWISLLAGLLMSFSILVRTNLILLAACAALIFVYEFLKTKKRSSIVNLLFYVVGGIIPLIILIIIYWSSDKLAYLKLGLITIPFEYSDARRSILGSVLRIGYKWLEFVLMKPLIVVPITTLLIISIFLLVKRFSNSVKNKKGFTQFFHDEGSNKIALIFLLYIMTYVSIIFSGKTYAHYQIQLFPFVSIMIMSTFLFTYKFRKATIILAILLMTTNILMLPASAKTIVNIGKIKENYKGLRISDKIKQNLNVKDSIWAIEQHIVLFYLRKEPVIPLTTHPSNLTQPSYVKSLAMFDPSLDDPFMTVINSLPKFIVCPIGLAPDYFNAQQINQFKTLLSDKYNLYYQDQGTSVYVRK